VLPRGGTGDWFRSGVCHGRSNVFGLSLLKFEGFLCLHEGFKGFGLELFGSLGFRIQAKGFLGGSGFCWRRQLAVFVGMFFCITSVMR